MQPFDTTFGQILDWGTHCPFPLEQPLGHSIISFCFCFFITSSVIHRPVKDNVTCSGEETLRVCCADVAFTSLHFQTSVVSVDDVDDIWSIAADSQGLVFTRRGT